MASDEGFELVEIVSNKPVMASANAQVQDAIAEPEASTSRHESGSEPGQLPEDVGVDPDSAGSLDLLRLSLNGIIVSIDTINMVIIRACQSVLAGPRDLDEAAATQEAIAILFIYVVEDIGQDHTDFLEMCSAISARTGALMRQQFGQPERCCVYL